MNWYISHLQVSRVPITMKMRTGIQENKSTAHKLITTAKNWGVSLMTVRCLEQTTATV